MSNCMRHERAKRSECAHAVRHGVAEAIPNTYKWGDDFIPRPPTGFFEKYFYLKKVHFTDAEDPGSNLGCSTGISVQVAK